MVTNSIFTVFYLFHQIIWYKKPDWFVSRNTNSPVCLWQCRLLALFFVLHWFSFHLQMQPWFNTIISEFRTMCEPTTPLLTEEATHALLFKCLGYFFIKKIFNKLVTIYFKDQFSLLTSCLLACMPCSAWPYFISLNLTPYQNLTTNLLTINKQQISSL